MKHTKCDAKQNWS